MDSAQRFRSSSAAGVPTLATDPLARRDSTQAVVRAATHDRPRGPSLESIPLAVVPGRSNETVADHRKREPRRPVGASVSLLRRSKSGPWKRSPRLYSALHEPQRRIADRLPGVGPSAPFTWPADTSQPVRRVATAITQRLLDQEHQRMNRRSRLRVKRHHLPVCRGLHA